MIYFLVIGFIILSGVFIIPKSFFHSRNIDPKKIVFVGGWSLGIACLLFVFHNFWMLLLVVLAVIIYNKIFD
jgi:hypothetical protein